MDTAGTVQRTGGYCTACVDVSEVSGQVCLCRRRRCRKWGPHSTKVESRVRDMVRESVPWVLVDDIVDECRGAPGVLVRRGES